MAFAPFQEKDLFTLGMLRPQLLAWDFSDRRLIVLRPRKVFTVLLLADWSASGLILNIPLSPIFQPFS